KIQPHICPKGLFENEMKNLFFILFSKDRECKFISRTLLRHFGSFCGRRKLFNFLPPQNSPMG
ncbi:MAG: hypothetical protein AAF599_21330, partial [Bacteroidota bacterium]